MNYEAMSQTFHTAYGNRTHNSGAQPEFWADALDQPLSPWQDEKDPNILQPQR